MSASKGLRLNNERDNALLLVESAAPPNIPPMAELNRNLTIKRSATSELWANAPGHEGGVPSENHIALVPRPRLATSARLDVRAFSEYPYVDRSAGTVSAEGMTPMRDLRPDLCAWLPPAAVPQLKPMVIEGTYAGCGIEAS